MLKLSSFSVKSLTHTYTQTITFSLPFLLSLSPPPPFLSFSTLHSKQMFSLCDNARPRDFEPYNILLTAEECQHKTYSTRFSTFCTATSYNTTDPYIACSPQYCRVSKNLKKKTGLLLPSYI